MFALILFSFMANLAIGPVFGKISSEVMELAKLTTVSLHAIFVDILLHGIPPQPELTIKYGYPTETHYVTTEDGYILAMHRLKKEGAQPFFLQHGLLDSSVTFVLMGPKIALAYLLWDLGYDVWMGNARGNRYSRNHTSLDPDNAAFWQFSWNEIGFYDLPAMIDYVLNATNFKKMFYAGHSQGTTAFWVMCSEKPAYNDKIILMQALAPAAFMSHIKTPLYRVFKDIAVSAIRVLGKHEILPQGILTSACFHEDERVRNMLINGFFLIVGKNEKEFNKTMWPAMCNHLPAGAATNQVVHYFQLIRSGRFCRYDFGLRKNLEKYGTRVPPQYNLSQVVAPVALYYSNNDFLTASVDVEFLHTQLGNPVEKYLIPMAELNHMDFVWGVNVRKIVYKRFLQVMRNYLPLNESELKPGVR